MKISLEPKPQATQCGLQLSLGDSLMCFVKEQMHLHRALERRAANPCVGWLTLTENYVDYAEFAAAITASDHAELIELAKQIQAALVTREQD